MKWHWITEFLCFIFFLSWSLMKMTKNDNYVIFRSYETDEISKLPANCKYSQIPSDFNARRHIRRRWVVSADYPIWLHRDKCIRFRRSNYPSLSSGLRHKRTVNKTIFFVLNGLQTCAHLVLYVCTLWIFF